MTDPTPTAEQALEALNKGVDAAIAWDTRAALDYIKVVRAYIEQTRQPALAVALPEKDDMHPTNRYLFRVLVAHHGIELGKDDISTALAKIPNKNAALALAGDKK